MKKIVCLTAPLFFLFTFAISANEFRTWTSANGKYKTEAKLVEISKDGKTATLRKFENKEFKDIDVPLEKLSKADQTYVQKWQKEMEEAGRELAREKASPEWKVRDRLAAQAQLARKKEQLERTEQNVQSLQQQAPLLRDQGAAYTLQLKQLVAEKAARIRNCRQCGGTGKIHERCYNCNATGRSTSNCSLCNGSGRTSDGKGVCSSCRGLGSGECSLCRGSGTQVTHCDCGCTEIDLAGRRIQGALQGISQALQMNQRELQKAQSTLRRHQSELERAQKALDQLDQGK